MSNRGSSGIRVKVSRQELIAAIEEKAAECHAEYEKAVKRYSLLASQYPKKVQAVLQAFAKEVSAMDREELLDTRRTDLKNKLYDRLPDLPTPPTEPEGYKRLVKLLSMGSLESLTISEAQFAEYMATCRR